MAKLETKCRHLIGESELLRFWPHAAYLIGRDARLDQLDSTVEPFAALLVGIELRRRGTTDVERAVVTGAVSHERLQDIEKHLVAGPHHTVCEIMRMRVATLAGDGVDRFDVV